MPKVLLSTQTASADSEIAFTSIFDSTYNLYEIHIIDAHPSSDAADLTWQANASSQSGYNETIQSNVFVATHGEDNTPQNVVYSTALDQQGLTGEQVLSNDVGADADQSVSGIVLVWNPTSTVSTTFWEGNFIANSSDNEARNTQTSGYFNVTAAIVDIHFAFSSGNIDSGEFNVYGSQT